MSIRAMTVLGALVVLAGCGGESGPSGPPSILGATNVAAGGAGTCALGGTGAMVCWGEVPSGVATDTTIGYGISLGARSVTVPESFTSISLSKTPFGSTGCGVGESGQVHCWGDLYIHYDGALSLGTTITALAGGSSAGSVSVGVGHLCVSRTDRLVRCYGDYNGGARGTDSVDLATVDPDATLTPNGLSPALSAFGTAQGAKFGCALTTDSLVACWGERSRGQVGRLTSDTVQDCGIFGADWCQPAPAPVDGGRKYRQVAVGWDAACATRFTGEVDCWGRKPGAPNCDVAADCVRSPTQVALPGSAVRVVVGANHACALLTTGAVYCWGDNAYGQLGRPGASSTTPVAVAGGYVFATLSAGGNHTCGIEVGTGAVGCWGANYTGQLGDGTLVDRDHPVAVVVAE